MKKLKTTLYWDRFHIGLLAVIILLFGLIDPWFILIGIIYTLWFRKSMHLGFVFCLLALFLARYYIWQNIQPLQYLNHEVKIVHIDEKLYQDQLTVRYQSIYVHIYTPKGIYEVGHIIKVEGEIKPYKKQTIPKGFDLHQYYLSRNIKGYIDDHDIEIIDQTFDFYFIRTYIKSHILKTQSQTYLNSLFLGIYDFPQETKMIYQSSGLWFLLSFSGIHLYVIIMMIRKAMFYLNVSDFTQKIVIIMIYVMLLYLQRGSWVIWRLIIMHSLNYLSYQDHLDMTKLERVLLGFLILLFFQIHLIHHLGFLITCCILAMLALFYERFNRYPVHMRHMYRSYFISFILLGFISSVHVIMLIWMPVFIFFFTYGVIPLAFLTLFFKPFDTYLYAIFKYYEALIEFLYQAANPIYLPKLIPSVSVLFVVGFLGLLSIPSKIKKLSIALLLMLIMFGSSLKTMISEGHIAFLDVEQGDSIVVVTPRCIIVIDSYQYVSSYLKAHGIQQIDYLILTHNHSDHTKEAIDILSQFRVHHLMINPYDDYQLTHSNTIKANHGDVISCGKLTIDILGPIKNYQNSNNNSLVLQFFMLDKMFLLTGDIEIMAENDLIKTYGVKLKSDVLKVAHHGSKTSTSETFLNYVQPQIAIISLKEKNRYGFPHQSVIERLISHDIIIYQTSQEGTIIYKKNFKREKWVFYLPF